MRLDLRRVACHEEAGGDPRHTHIALPTPHTVHLRLGALPSPTMHRVCVCAAQAEMVKHIGLDGCCLLLFIQVAIRMLLYCSTLTLILYSF